MQEFYIDVVLHRGATRVQVDEVPPESWAMPGTPQFIIEFHTPSGFLTLTLQLEGGNWYDRNTRLSEDDFHLRYFELGPDETWNPDYESPLSTEEIKAIGAAISNHMIVSLTAYMGLFVPQFRNPTLN
ncbi:MAG: hypothetical protein EOO05_21640 [Chitinophagaceae bacterium]|nr:MAG: hypothetical protein EOO05_21640 [Chitinophagaceae bacterium]